MKPKTMILVGAAIVCGLGAAYMTNQLIANQNKKVEIYVASKRLAQYAQITNPDDMFKRVEVLKSDMPRNAIQNPEDLKERFLIHALDQDKPVVLEDLQEKSKQSVEALLSPGCRAYTIRVTAETVAGGWAQAGSRVDIIYSGRRNERDTETKPILQNIKVLAADLQSQRPEEKPGAVPSTVTLELKPDQVLFLDHYRSMGGQISLALLGFNDREGRESAYKTTVTDPKPEAIVEKKEPPKPQKKVHVCMIYNGGNWIRATHVYARPGEVVTEIDRSQGEAAAPPAPIQVQAPAPVPVGVVPVAAPQPGAPVAGTVGIR